MARRFLFQCIPFSILLVAACVSDDDSSGADAGGNNQADGGNARFDAGPTPDSGPTPDGGGNGDPCAEFAAPAMVLNTYPATVSSNLIGTGADINIGEGVCTDERSYFSQVGEELVLRLDDLTPGTGYVINIQSGSDISFYVTTGCSSPSLSGECLLFVDEEIGDPERGDFVAPANGTVYVVVDHFGEPPVSDGSFTITIVEPECTVDTDCNGTLDTPFCSNNICVACTTSIQCDSTAAPICDVGGTNACAAGFDLCTGDDASPPENADDGPVGATALTPAEGAPVLVNAKICSSPATESDHYSFSVADGDVRVFSLDWTDITDDLDLIIIDSEGVGVANAFANKPEVLIADDLPAGDYFLIVSKFESDGIADPAAVDYTLTASLPECETSFDCGNGATPFCGSALTCVAGSSECTNDIDDVIQDNDGPAGAITLTDGVAMDAAICNTPGSELDYFSITLGDTQDMEVSIDFADVNPNDLDVRVLDSTGELMALGFYQVPETVNLSYLPAGEYLIEVAYFGAAVTAALNYSVTATLTDNGNCATATDCAAEFSTQVYRGSCNTGTGACESIDGAGALAQGVACDSGDDCTSGFCSNLLFQQNAQTSVCTISCNDNTDCAALTGFSCTVPFVNNTCHPDCTSGLECGANPGSANLDANQPWDYLTCTAGACDVDP